MNIGDDVTYRPTGAPCAIWGIGEKDGEPVLAVMTRDPMPEWRDFGDGRRLSPWLPIADFTAAPAAPAVS